MGGIKKIICQLINFQLLLLVLKHTGGGGETALALQCPHYTRYQHGGDGDGIWRFLLRSRCGLLAPCRRTAGPLCRPGSWLEPAPTGTRAALPSSLGPRCQCCPNHGQHQHRYPSTCELAEPQGDPTTQRERTSVFKPEVNLQANSQENLPFVTCLEPAYSPPEAEGHFKTHSSAGHSSFVCPLAAVVSKIILILSKIYFIFISELLTVLPSASATSSFGSNTNAHQCKLHLALAP